MTDSSRPDATRGTPAVRRAVLALARRLRRERAPHGISSLRLLVLSRLVAGPATGATIAAAERIQPQSLTRVIADLEDRGFLRRRLDQTDRRLVPLEITAKGLHLLAQDAARQDAWLAQAMEQRLTPAEREIVRIAADLLARLGNDPEAEE